ncbi:MAG: D-2-hydroxyacid dehydrogenase [Candidatus Koribacter versatilis]|uniref:D-2-hydroxyacid dehydrogenase n=1 Tax=Candidatus Korobacter versatilis TaxID=658062 RepID=A0A932ENL7_9BACT|nr:D-2-hydroxyacid dehydrogenase [Candidatus Koribacter versatilis]
MKLLITTHHRFELWNAPPWFAERLRAAFPQLEVTRLAGYDRFAAELPAADILIGWSLKPEQLALAHRLRWIYSPAAAVHALLSPELAATNIVVTNASAVHGPVVAEHALALMLALAKRIPQIVHYQDQRAWAQQSLWDQAPRPRELSGATLALIGYGAIGSTAAQLALAFGMDVLVVREHPEPATRSSQLAPHNSIQQFGDAQLDAVLARADFVLLAAPLTPKTRHMINAERLARMKPGAYLINVARGPLIDDAALIAALRENRIAGAALDVFEREPLAADSPYWQLPNVLITPHSAALTERLWERHYALFTENLRRFLAGQPLTGVVDKSAGY